MKTSSLKPIAARHAHGGFTLVELLLVVAIIAVLSTLAINVIASSENDARVSATRSRMEVIEKLLATELEDFEVRRSPLPFPVVTTITGLVTGKPTPKWSAGPTTEPFLNFRNHTRNLKRMLTLDLMRSEFPDVSSGPVVLGAFPSPQLQSYFQNDLLLSPEEVSSIVITARQHNTANVARWSSWGGTVNTSSNLTAGDEQNAADSAEILYKILSDLDAGGSTGIDAIGGSRATGDTDADGFPEVIDSWGDPIRFQFHQNLVIPVEEEGPLVGGMPTLLAAMNNQSGVWKDWEGLERFTTFDVTLPVLPSEVRFVLSSARILEIEGLPTDVISPAEFIAVYRP